MRFSIQGGQLSLNGKFYQFYHFCLPYILPSLYWLVVSQVVVGQHVDVVCQLRRGGEDEHHGGENHHAHRGESVKLMFFLMNKL